MSMSQVATSDNNEQRSMQSPIAVPSSPPPSFRSRTSSRRPSQEEDHLERVQQRLNDAFISDDTSTALGDPDGDLRLVPDLDRLVPLAGQPGWAWAPADRYQQTGEAWGACQRLFARAQVDEAEAAGLRLKTAFACGS